MYLYLNGSLLGDREAFVPANDHGFLYGAGFFETFRTYGTRPHLLNEHLQRLKNACWELNILPGPDLLMSDRGPSERSRDQTYPRFLETISLLLKKNGLSDAVFRYTLTAGAQQGGLPKGPYILPTELLTLRPLPVSSDRGGVTLHLLETRRSRAEISPRPKSTSYLNILIAHQELLRRNLCAGDEGLMLNGEGQICEGVTSNLFFLRRGILKTPSDSTGILPGITRRSVMNLAKRHTIPVEEGPFSLAELEQSEAIFLTNSVRGLFSVNQFVSAQQQVTWKGASETHPTFLLLKGAYEETLPPHSS